MLAKRNRNLFVIVALALSMIVIMVLAVAPSAAAPTINKGAASDYAQRHPELSNPAIQKAIGSDYHERHPELIHQATGKEIDLTWPPRPDFSHLVKKANQYTAAEQARSDYFTRHPEFKERVSTDIDTSDYFLRHRTEFQSTRETVLWSNFLKHPYARKAR